MTTMKLSDFCDSRGIAYITGYRWFKEGKMPENVHAYQAPSGMILIDEIALENNIGTVQTATFTQNEPLSVFLNGVAEHTKNNATIKQFAGYVLSNFRLELNNSQTTLATNSALRGMSFNNELHNSEITLSQVPAFDMHNVGEERPKETNKKSKSRKKKEIK
jgi:hypothetical protein